MRETLRDQVCTPEQMTELKNLGIDITKASACLLTMKLADGSDQTIVTEPCNLYGKAAIPVFTITVADILDMLPESIKDNYNRINYYFDLLVLKSNRRYACIYVNKHLKQTIYSSGDYLLLRDALFDILVQLKKDNKL